MYLSANHVTIKWTSHLHVTVKIRICIFFKKLLKSNYIHQCLVIFNLSIDCNPQKPAALLGKISGNLI